MGLLDINAVAQDAFLGIAQMAAESLTYEPPPYSSQFCRLPVELGAIVIHEYVLPEDRLGRLVNCMDANYHQTFSDADILHLDELENLAKWLMRSFMVKHEGRKGIQVKLIRHPDRGMK
ncbi:hypothetical protein ACN47E_009459 [Coniothyrium glycines]